MIKGFIEVHNAKDSNMAVLINVSHITDVRQNIIYMDFTPDFSTDYDCVHCSEDYLEIAAKIKEAVGDSDA